MTTSYRIENGEAVEAKRCDDLRCRDGAHHKFRSFKHGDCNGSGWIGGEPAFEVRAKLNDLGGIRGYKWRRYKGATHNVGWSRLHSSTGKVKTAAVEALG